MDVFIELPVATVAIDDRNVARLVAWRGHAATFQRFGGELARWLRAQAVEAYEADDEEREEALVTAFLLIEREVHPLAVCCRALIQWRRGELSERQLVEAWSR